MLWVLAVLAVCGVLSPLASHRLRAVDRWLTYGVGLIRAADRSGGIRVAYPPLVEGVPAKCGLSVCDRETRTEDMTPGQE